MTKLERFTQKAREALEAAQDALGRLHQTQLDTEHLLYGLAFVEGSLLPRVFEHAGIDAARALSSIREAVERGQQLDDAAGHSDTAQAYLRPDSAAVLAQAEDEMEQMGDKFVGTEHILLALLSLRRGRGYTVLTRLGLDRDKVYAALKDLRGAQSLDSESGEEKYQALERFSVDLTARAPGAHRPHHRARDGDRAGGADPQPPQQEQPGAHRRAACGFRTWARRGSFGGWRTN